MNPCGVQITQNVKKVEAGGTVVGMQVFYEGEPVVIPSPEQVQEHRAALVAKAEYARWADEFYIHEEGKVLPLFASPYEDDGGRKREDLLQTIRSHQRLLVLGEPGMGKTVAMERMMWETAQAKEVAVPILVPLLYFQGADLIESVRIALNETGKLVFDNARSVHAFLRETPCLILLDGLNETPGKQREQAIGAIANLMREYPQHRYVVTSRSQDELWRKLRSGDLIQDTVVIQQISDAQAQGYLVAHLKEKGQALYDRLDASLKSLARTPLLLWLVKEAGQGSGQLPLNRGELFDKFVMNRLLEREKKLETSEQAQTKKNALAQLAFAMQLEHQLSCDRAWAEKVLNSNGWKEKADTILSEALVHGLLLQQDRPGQQQLRFMHQSVQEYFVARKLHGEVAIERRANLLQSISRQFSRSSLTAWAQDTWWAESFVQLAGLVDDADWLARRIAAGGNPWLAWWCVQEGRAVQKGTREMIEARSIKLLYSPKVAERRRAVQTLAQIKNDRVLESLLIAAGDDDQEVEGLGLQVLAENGEAVRPLIKKAMHGDDRKAVKASFRYLGIQPYDTLWSEIPRQAWEEVFGQSMVWVPAGEFLMGSDKSKDPKAYDSESPQHFLTLPAYWIGCFPVTVAQWKVFVKESGYQSDQKSLQDPDDHPVRYVNWNDAMAYCTWLSEKSGLPVTLPSEAEWEKAARGTDGRIYPWGNEFDKDKCNTIASYIGTTTPVGKYFPAGNSPYGCADMVGNVLEWTRSKFKFYPYKAGDGRESLEGTDNRVVRGGSWLDNQAFARASSRNINPPNYRNLYLGFRVVVRPPTMQG